MQFLTTYHNKLIHGCHIFDVIKSTHLLYNLILKLNTLYYISVALNAKLAVPCTPK